MKLVCLKSALAILVLVFFVSCQTLSYPWLKLVDETCNVSKAGVNGTSDTIRVDDVDDQPLSSWINIPTGSVQYTKAISIQSSLDVSFIKQSGLYA